MAFRQERKTKTGSISAECLDGIEEIGPSGGVEAGNDAHRACKAEPDPDRHAADEGSPPDADSAHRKSAANLVACQHPHCESNSRREVHRLGPFALCSFSRDCPRFNQRILLQKMGDQSTTDHQTPQDRTEIGDGMSSEIHRGAQALDHVARQVGVRIIGFRGRG
jgi:hypothetical protein